MGRLRRQPPNAEELAGCSGRNIDIDMRWGLFRGNFLLLLETVRTLFARGTRPRKGYSRRTHTASSSILLRRPLARPRLVPEPLQEGAALRGLLRRSCRCSPPSPPRIWPPGEHLGSPRRTQMRRAAPMSCTERAFWQCWACPECQSAHRKKKAEKGGGSFRSEEWRVHASPGKAGSAHLRAPERRGAL